MAIDVIALIRAATFACLMTLGWTLKMILVPAMLCMMPGITAYKAMISFVQLGYYGYNPQVFTQMMDFSFNAIFVTAALVFGISLPTSFWYRTKPIV